VVKSHFTLVLNVHAFKTSIVFDFTTRIESGHQPNNVGIYSLLLHFAWVHFQQLKTDIIPEGARMLFPLFPHCSRACDKMQPMRPLAICMEWVCAVQKATIDKANEK
jgi:hypothetical protein